MRSRLVWKLSAAVVAILIAAITLSGYLNDLICAHYSLESARAFLKFNSESIINGIGQLMMSRNNPAIEELIVEMSQDSTVYGDIQLVSHHSGEVVACRVGGSGTKLGLEDRACTVCHDRDDLGGANPEIVDTVIRHPGGDRVLLVMAPIFNEPSCRSAACHAHAESPPILGFLNADYSLERMDASVLNRRILITVAVVVSLVLGIIALWFTFARLLERPIKGLIAGTERIAAHQLDFRFDQTRNDEIGVLEKSFNAMTARIQAHQDELHSAMCYLEGIVESSADIIITVTPDGYIETFNRGAEAALGYRRTDVIGQRIEMLFAEPQERDAAVKMLKDTDSVKNYETRFLAKDGQVRNVLLTLSRLRDQKGIQIGTFGISKDVTGEKKLQRELVQSQKLAAIGQAVTGVQHAIKNLLSSLKGGAYLVRNGLAKEDGQWITEGWAMVEEGIERISDFSHSMLNYAREWKLDFQRADLGELVAKTCELNRQTAVQQDVSLDCAVSDGLPAVLCDPKLIHVAVSDLLVNAIDACAWKDYGDGESPEVMVRTYLADREDFVVIEVRDNGCGMNEEIRRHVFTPFFSTKGAGGVGLGLAMTSRIINVHRGEVSVESEPDKGSIFRFHLAIDGPKQVREAVNVQAGSHH